MIPRNARFEVFELGDRVDEIHAGINQGVSQNQEKWKLMTAGTSEHAELFVNSRGSYFYTCFCGETTNGHMREFRTTLPLLTCSNYHCQKSVDMILLNQKYI